MNSITQKQFTNIAFNCSFCSYQSKLDLKECPGCGRVKRVSKQTINQSGRAVDLQYQNREIISFNTPLNPTTQEPKNFYYECTHCHYRKPKYLRECPECGRIDSTKKVFLASESGADKANNQNLEKRKRLIEAASPLIFENAHIRNAVAVSLVLFIGVFLIHASLSIMLIYFVSMALFILFSLIFYCMHVALNKDVIAQKNLLGGWEVSWSQITGWNEIALGEGITSICFRTETDIYKISGQVLSNPRCFEFVKERFEWHCGDPLEGSNRIGGI